MSDTQNLTLFKVNFRIAASSSVSLTSKTINRFDMIKCAKTHESLQQERTRVDFLTSKNSKEKENHFVMAYMRYLLNSIANLQNINSIWMIRDTEHTPTIINPRNVLWVKPEIVYDTLSYVPDGSKDYIDCDLKTWLTSVKDNLKEGGQNRQAGPNLLFTVK